MRIQALTSLLIIRRIDRKLPAETGIMSGNTLEFGRQHPNSPVAAFPLFTLNSNIPDATILPTIKHINSLVNDKANLTLDSTFSLWRGHQTETNSDP